MGNLEQTILLVSDDATLCATARRILEGNSPAVILLEEASVAAEAGESRGIAPRLDAVVTSLAVHAPVVVIGAAEKRAELSALIEAGVADYVPRNGGSLLATLGLVQRRLEQSQKMAASTSDHLMQGEADFGEVLRHELNNPLTGILGNAELLLVEIHRKKDGRIPHGGEQRLETIAALAVRLRETVRRLSQEWEARQHPVH